MKSESWNVMSKRPTVWADNNGMIVEGTRWELRCPEGHRLPYAIRTARRAMPRSAEPSVAVGCEPCGDGYRFELPAT